MTQPHDKDEVLRMADIRNAQIILGDIWGTWYPGMDYVPAENMTDLLHQIFNSLWGIPHFAKTVDERLKIGNAIHYAGNKP